MVATTFTLVSGTYTDEQDLLGELDFFMTQTIGGWVQAKVVADTDPVSPLDTFMHIGKTESPVIKTCCTAKNSDFSDILGFNKYLIITAKCSK